MPETPEVTETDAAETAVSDTADEAQKPTETVDFWKAKAREQEKRAKENATAAKELENIRDAQKTEAQRLVERAEAAEQRAAALESAQEVAGWKAQVSKKTGVPAEVLRGTTLDELEDHAASLKALLPTPGAVRSEGRTVANGGSGDPATQFGNILKQQLNS